MVPPALASDDYALEVRAHINRTSEIRTGRLPETLAVA
jgi:hypothetical protein